MRKEKQQTDCIPSLFELFTRKLFGLSVFFPLSLSVHFLMLFNGSRRLRYSPHLIFGHCQWFIICVSPSHFLLLSFFFSPLPFPHSFSMKGDDMLFAQTKKKKEFHAECNRKWADENFFVAGKSERTSFIRLNSPLAGAASSADIGRHLCIF